MNRFGAVLHVSLAWLCATGSSAMELTLLSPLDGASPPMRHVVEQLNVAAGGIDSPASIRIALRDSPGLTSDLRDGTPDDAEAFALHPHRERNALTVVGADVRGALYGALWLADRLKVEGRAAFARTDARAPVFRARYLLDGPGTRVPKGSPPETELAFDVTWTCNTHTVAGHFGGAPGNVYVDEIDPRLVDDVEAHRRTVDRNRAASRAHIDLITEWHLDPLANCSPFYDMPPLVDKLIEIYGREVSEDGLTLSQALDKPWEVWQAMQRQYLQAFPRVTGIRSSMGEGPEHLQIWRSHGPKSAALAPAGGMRRFLERAREVIVEECGRELVVSAWGNPPEEYPLNDPASLRMIFRDVAADDKITLLSNECEHDFYLISPFNDNFGVADVGKGMMFQVQREYQGRGYLPVYVGQRIHDHMSRAAHLGEADAAAARLWWNENFYDELCWTRWNLYAWMRACWEPDGDPWEWARDYSVTEFGTPGAELLADVLMMTEDLAARAFYMPGWTGRKRDAYAITHRCVFTDGRHYWRVTPDPHREAYEENHVAGRVPLLRAQIQDTRALNDGVLERASAATEAMADAGQARMVLESFDHLHAVVSILTHYQEALLLWHYKDEPYLTPVAAAEMRSRCAAHARSALDGFVAYRAKYDLYKDGGMVPLLRSYLKALGAEAPPEIDPLPTFPLPRVAGPMPTDGTLSDQWPEPCLVLRPGRVEGSSAPSGDYGEAYGSADIDYSAAFRLAAGPDALFVSVDVHDDMPPVGARVGRIYHSDSIGLSFDTNDDGIDEALYYLALDAETGRPRILTVMRDRTQNSLNFEDYRGLGDGDPGAQAVLVEADDGYRWQASIPWSMLGGYDPDGGGRLGIEFIANNAEKVGERARLRLKYPRTRAWRDTPPTDFVYGIPQRRADADR